PAHPWGALHATEELGPGAALAAWKAVAVVGMLERRVGEDTFKRLLERHVVASCAAGAPAGATPGPFSRTHHAGRCKRHSQHSRCMHNTMSCGVLCCRSTHDTAH